MAEIIDIANAMFKNRSEWSKLKDTEKEEFSFIFNRFFSRKYPFLAESFNNKTQDKVLMMDIWFEFMKDKGYPNWFWPKTKKNNQNDKYSNKEKEELIKFLQLNKIDDLEFLIKNNPEFIEEEYQYLKSKNKTK